jgi:hypothetical protein
MVLFNISSLAKLSYSSISKNIDVSLFFIAPKSEAIVEIALLG